MLLFGREERKGEGEERKEREEKGEAETEWGIFPIYCIHLYIPLYTFIYFQIDPYTFIYLHIH